MKKKYEPIVLPDQVAPKHKHQAHNKALVSFFIYAFIGLWLSTQYMAWKFHYASALKTESLWGYLYLPWAAFIWGDRFLEHTLPVAVRGIVYSTILQTVGIFVLLLIVAGILAALDKAHNIKSIPPIDHRHGSAHWAEAADFGEMDMLPPDHPAIQSANARAKKRGRHVTWENSVDTLQWKRRPGVIIGQWTDESGRRNWLRDTSNLHLGAIAPTRAGKGVSLNIPACLTWTESLFANDPKKELYNTTAWYRRHVLKQLIFRIDLMCTNGTATRINPMDWIRVGTEHDVGDAQQLANVVCDPLGLGETGGDSDHWKGQSIILLNALILHVLYDPKIKKKTLTAIDDILSSPIIETRLPELAKTAHDLQFTRKWLTTNSDGDMELTQTCPTVSKACNAIMNKDIKERSGIISSLNRYFDIYRDPIVAANISDSDLSIEDIMRADKAVTVYLTNPPSDELRLRPLIRLFVNTIVTRFCGEVEFDNQNRPLPSYKHQLLLILDEFTSTLGKMPILANAIAFLAGYGIKLFLIVQNLTQFSETYGDKTAASMMSNLNTQIFFASNDPDTQYRLSRMLGERTIRGESTSFNSGKESSSESYTARPLLKPNEIQDFDPNKEIVIMRGHPPALLDRVIYYKEPALFSRCHPPIEADGKPMQMDKIPREDWIFTKEMGPKLQEALGRAAEREAEAKAIFTGNPGASIDKRLIDINRRLTEKQRSEAQDDTDEPGNESGGSVRNPLPLPQQPASGFANKPETQEDTDAFNDEDDFSAQERLRQNMV